MPAISMFFGILIYMYRGDHNPPHFHAIYQDYEGIFDLDGNLMEGDLPPKQIKLVTAWALIHQEELAADWNLVQERESVFKIEPLR